MDESVNPPAVPFRNNSLHDQVRMETTPLAISKSRKPVVIQYLHVYLPKQAS